MGQTINVSPATVVGQVALFDTDRSLSGQDGETYHTAADAEAGTTFPAALAQELFETDRVISSVYVYSNVVSVERPAGWDDAAKTGMSEAIRDFFVIYDENKGDQPTAE